MMDIRNRRTLKEAAGARLAAADYDPRRLALIHTGVGVAAGLLIALMDYMLSNYMENTGGLSGIGLRSALGTLQVVLQYARNLATPFWQIGFVYAMLRISRGESVRPGSLLEGFRRFGPVLRLRIMEGAIYLGAFISCLYVGSYLLMLTPLGQPLLGLLEPLISEDATIEQVEAAILQQPAEQLYRAAWPLILFCGVLALVAGLFLFYSFRMADFILMDKPRTGALVALAGSRRMTRKNRFALLGLDLSFWWFYALSGVCILLGYLDYLLPLVGVSLPVSADAAWFISYALGLFAQLALHWYGHSYVQTTFACAYDALKQRLQEAPVPQEVPRNLPWEDYPEQ